MGSVMSLSCSKRKATSEDVESESRKRRKICSTNDDDENCRVIPSPTLPDELSWKHRWSFCANRVVNVAAAVFTKFRSPQDMEDTKSSSLSLPSPPTSLSLPSPPSPLSLPSPPTSLSLPSPPPSLSQIWKHDVFPSFHGADVRKTIRSHILESFKRKGIEAFIDDNIERSKSIGPELVEAIKGSKIAIVLLSKNYASSSWCLDELVEIMKCREGLGQIVMTIFCEVDPTDIKKQTGDFGKAFKKTCKGKTKEHIERWRRALEDVATIAGEHNWENEATMIEKIATDVLNILNISTPSRDFDGFVGMRTHMEEMKELFRLDLDKEVRMIGIWGPPGIGKTTIATFMFDRFSNKFQLATIMEDIREYYPRHCLNERNAQLKLQNQMLSQILNHKDIKISHLGVAQDRLKGKKVLLVLDEVDQLEQLDALAKEKQWFGPGSRIIITTEDLRVLKAHRINHIYKVKFPSSDEALQIFCMHAFGQKHPYEGFYMLAREVASLAGELPLGLKVLGSALRGMSKPEWKMILPSLKTCLDGKIENIIKFSYDALRDEDKYLFLYIACLFNYQYAHKVEEVLANKFLHVRHGLHVLEERSLISIGYGSTIQMHSLLVQFGKETSREQLVRHGYTKRQLLVGERDTCELLSDDDSTDSKRFIGINLDLSETEEELNISEKALERMHDFQFVRINNHHLAQHERLQGLIYHSQKIRSLRWKQFQNICLPSTFNPEFLVELKMLFSKLEKLWEGTKPLKNLKWMDLSDSRYLKELPDLSTATKLEELTLENCSSLLELPSSIGNAINLQKLNLTGCSSLLELPSSIGNAINLQELNLSHCRSLVKLPFPINSPNLRRLDLRNCSRVVALPAIENATNLRELNLQNCSSLQELPPSIGNATRLMELNISGCSSLVALPSSIGKLQNLGRLNMLGCLKLEALPTNIKLRSLCVLDLTDCSQLKSFPDYSTNINELILIGTAIKEVPLSIMSWSGVRDFKMSYFESLKEFTHALDIITELHFVNEDIKEVPTWVKGMSSLRKLRLGNCNNLVSLPQFSDSLDHLVAENCQSLERLDCSFNNRPFCLEFVNCPKLNQEARDLIMHTSTRYYAVLPGTEVPDCFNHRATGGGSLTIKLNESPLPTSLRFKACIMPVKVNEEESGDDEEESLVVNIDIMDKQKGLKVQCTPSSYYPYRILTEHIYTFEVEAEEVTSTELVFQFKTRRNSMRPIPILNSKWKIGECGLFQIKKEESEDTDEEMDESEDTDEEMDEYENSTLGEL